MPQAERFLHVSPVREVSSAPHSRSCSFKTYRRPQDLDLWDSRPRTNSLPACPGRIRQRHSSDSSSTRERERDSERLFRVRSFKLTSKGLVNHGDSFKRRSTHSLMSSGSAATDHSEQRPRTLSVASEESGGISATGSCCAPSYFRVALLGAGGVGKSALIRQFMTSEYKGTFDIATPDAEDPETTVSVLLDGEESMIEFLDEPNENDLDNARADAFAVVFSLADVTSYNTAISIVRHLRVDLCSDRAIVLVGNKVDLARQRRVSARDARLISMKYDCKYEETSAALNHHVDELLVGILSQIRLKLAPPPDTLLTPEVTCSKGRSQSPRRAMSFLSKLFSQTKKKAKSCDNLLIH